MDAFENDKLSALLSNPESMEKIAGLAKIVGASMGASPGDADKSGEGVLSLKEGLAPLSGLLSKQKERTALLSALTPYLREERREKLKTVLGAMKALEIISNIGDIK